MPAKYVAGSSSLLSDAVTIAASKNALNAVIHVELPFFLLPVCMAVVFMVISFQDMKYSIAVAL